MPVAVRTDRRWRGEGPGRPPLPAFAAGPRGGARDSRTDSSRRDGVSRSRGDSSRRSTWRRRVRCIARRLTRRLGSEDERQEAGDGRCGRRALMASRGQVQAGDDIFPRSVFRLVARRESSGIGARAVRQETRAVRGVHQDVGADHVEVDPQTPLSAGDGVVFDTGGDTDHEQGGRIWQVRGQLPVLRAGPRGFRQVEAGRQGVEDERPATSTRIAANLQGRHSAAQDGDRPHGDRGGRESR